MTPPYRQHRRLPSPVISAAGLQDVLVSMWWDRAKRDREFWARDLRYALGLGLC